MRKCCRQYLPVKVQTSHTFAMTLVKGSQSRRKSVADGLYSTSSEKVMEVLF